MYYQVVARALAQNDEPAPERWEYYPVWEPIGSKLAAMEEAEFAASTGRETAILQANTVDSLKALARHVVEQQQSQLVPALRYVPGASVVGSDGRTEHVVEVRLCAASVRDLYGEGPDKFELDQRRLHRELGAGGDVLRANSTRVARVSLPQRMDVLSAWLRVRERVQSGQLGGTTDGEPHQQAGEQ